MSLVVTGTIGIDTIQTPVSGATEVLGGSCTYFAAAAAFHGPVRLVAAVGDDFPEAHVGTLRSFRSIDTAGLEIRRGSKTFRWGGRYLENMDHRESLFTHLGVLAEAPPPVPAAFADSRFVFLANMHPRTQGAMLDRFPNRALAVADTMDLWIDNEREALTALLRRIDGLVLNYDEAELYTGKKNPVTAARHILGLGPRFVVVKKGEHGALLIHRNGIGALPAFPSEEVVDPTGAGDTFAGGMMGFLAGAGDAEPGFDSLRRALAHGTVMASFTIEAFSLDRIRRLTATELSERTRAYTEMLRI